ncbi:DsrE/DsrF/DrsH-like family protein [Salinicoccus halitifaciens]|uniref:Peroxiredoxin family protein/rhodanese-related sulfurtransferase/TusA-related sulfurtransferase n=1 Tax=Salinicoccus halitifaciens TaxID=1073415 RepID=A0ABV2E8Z3_9STAP|nr:DsrE/DsrF/DrsH-like family protein [Salinicoccus halitifaciens]MCD2138007.1 DsrE/DsrF/DrsH-like family protein [Salinicoccus halitifaciens]
MSNAKIKYHINDADRLVEANEYLLDVREPFEYEMGHIAEADNVSVNEIEDRLDELPKDRKIHVYCQRGKRGANAVEILKTNGFDAVNLEEGYSAYTGKYDSAQETAATAEDVSADNVEIDPNRVKVEASGLQCPGPLLKVNEVMGELEPGQQMEITVTDFGFCTDVEAWARKTGHSVLKNEKMENKVEVVLRKNAPQAKTAGEGHQMVETKDGATMVVFSGDMDKALASFIIATGAKSMGKDVTMFFTFWGLNVIKDPKAPKKNKTGLDKAFSMMMPKSASRLPISNMNMFGLGSKMIQYVMKKKKVDALTEMIEKADKLGVKMVACTMSMDIMAIDEDELLPNVNFGGVGTYLGDAENGNLNLFI